MIKVKENPDLVKDKRSNAVLNSNADALKEHRNKKHYFNNMLARINSLEIRLLEIEEKMQKILDK